MPKIRMPDGVVVRFPDDMPADQIKGLIAQKFPELAQQPAPQAAPPAAPNPRSFSDFMKPKLLEQMQQPVDPQAAAQPPLPAYKGNTFNAATEGSHAGVLGGFDDEATAAIAAPGSAVRDWYNGKGFDLVGAYTRKQQELDAQKGARRAEHPIASLGGEVAGGLALGGAVRGKSGAPVTPANRLVPYIGRTGASAVEGAAYGGVYGAGEAKPGERLEGAGRGAMTGATVGATLSTLGGALARNAGSKAVAKAAPPAPGSDELEAASNALYGKMDAAGVVVKPQSVDRIFQNAKAAAGPLNETLRPNTLGTLKDIAKLRGQPMSLRRLDELRQEVRLNMKRAQPQDVRTLERIKTVLDNFADNAKAGVDVTGDIRGFDYLKDARKLWARKAKTEVVENILDAAEVRTGQYTQSGLANTISKEMRTLYKSIKSGRTKGFSAEEVALVRQMANGGSNSMTIRLLAKFAPRGVVSAIGGFALGGPALTLAGHVAGKVADKGAVTAANALRDAASRGYVYKPQIPQLPNKMRPLIPAGVAASTEVDRILSGGR
jgi:hypothetical protein